MSEPLTRLFRVEVDGPKAGNPLWWEVRVALHDHPLVTVGTLHPPPQHEGDGPPFAFTAHPVGSAPAAWTILEPGPYASIQHFMSAIEERLFPTP